MANRWGVFPNPRIRQLADMFQISSKDMTSLMRSLGVIHRKQERRLFTTKGASGGPKWKPLSKAYLRAKRRSRASPRKKRCTTLKVMQCTKALKNSLTKKGHPQSVEYFTMNPKRQVIFGTKDEKAGWHSGGSQHNPRLPVRHVMQFGPKQSKELAADIQKYFREIKIPRIIRVLNAAAKVKAGTHRG